MIIRLQNVTKTFLNITALDGLTAEFAQSQIIAVTGSNGAGKTTLLKILSGHIRPSEGDIYFDGEKYSRDRIDLRKKTVVLPDIPAVYWNMSPLQHAAMLFRLYDKEPVRAVDLLIGIYKSFEILPCVETPFCMLSKGLAYKGVLSAALALEPELMLLDEPFASGMDPSGIANFKKYAREAKARGATVIYTTQILEVNQDFCDLVCSLDKTRN